DGLGVHVDRALEPGAVLDADPRRNDIALDVRARAHDDALDADEVAFHHAFDLDRARDHVRLHAALRADRQTIVLEQDRALDLALDQQVLLAAQIAVDADRRADHRDVAAARAPRRLALRREARGLIVTHHVLPLVRALLADVEHIAPVSKSVSRVCRRRS